MTKKTVNNILFLVGLFFVIVMIFTFDVSFKELWEDICRAGYWMLLVLGLWPFLYLINAFAWREIIYSNCSIEQRPSLARIFRLTITGYALNNTTPVGGLGGEPYRIIELTKHMDKENATSSTILYAMMHIYSHFWFWFTSIILYLILAFSGNLPLNVTIGLLLLFLFVICCVGLYFFAKGYKNGLVVKAISFVGHLPRLKNWSSRFLATHNESLNKIDEQIAALHHQSRRAFYRSLILEWLARVAGALEVTFILFMLGKNGDGSTAGYLLVLLHAILIVALTSFLANILGFLPMQIGVQEGGYAASIFAMGLTPDVGIFISVIVRVRQVIWNTIGVLMMKL